MLVPGASVSVGECHVLAPSRLAAGIAPAKLRVLTRVRRRIAAGRAAVIALSGGILAVPAGLLPRAQGHVATTLPPVMDRRAVRVAEAWGSPEC